MNLIKSIHIKQKTGLVPVIAEIKRRIPKLAKEKGLKTDLRDAGLLAKKYFKGGAMGISLVTEKKHFGGQPEIDIPRVLTSVRLPLLIKDFITNKATVDYYADLVAKSGKKMLDRVTLLLTAHHLKDKLSKLIDYVHQKGMSVQIEIRGKQDLCFLKNLRLMPKLIAINNKKIDEFEMGEDKVIFDESLVKTFREVIGKSLLISCSAHHLPKDVKVSIKAGADAVLTGTVFMQAKNPITIIKSFVNALKKEI